MFTIRRLRLLKNTFCAVFWFSTGVCLGIVLFKKTADQGDLIDASRLSRINLRILVTRQFTENTFDDHQISSEASQRENIVTPPFLNTPINASNQTFHVLATGQPSIIEYTNVTATNIDNLSIHETNLSSPAWMHFQNRININKLYDPSDPAIDQLLKDLGTLPIEKCYETDAGSQVKLFVALSDGGGAVLKPMKQSRDKARRGKNQFYFSEMERHNAEIASYHLDRALGFFRVPPTVGRQVSIGGELQPTASDSFNTTMFISPAGNLCFTGNCDNYCDMARATCGHPDLIEVSMQAMFPLEDEIKTIKSPWKRSYNRHLRPFWENDVTYCLNIERRLNSSRLLLDIIDVYIFDFIADNQDRHHITSFERFGQQGSPVLFDNGRAFGDPEGDDMTILAPLLQCCLIRYSSLKKLLHFAVGPKKLSQAFDESCRVDIAYPLASNEFLEAMDRRVGIILHQVESCIEQKDFPSVVRDDGF